MVIAIIGLLLAMLIPSLQIAKQHATAAVCLSNINGLSKSWYLYTGDNDDNICSGATQSSADPYYDWVEVPQDEGGTSKQDGSTVAEEVIGIGRGVLFEYADNPKNYHCPGDKRYLKPPEDPGYSGDGGYRSYSMPGGFRGVGEPWKTNDAGGWEIIALTRVNNLKSPGDKYVFVEEADGRGYNWGAWVLRPLGPAWVDTLSIWHNDRSTLGFADGHAEKHYWVDPDTVEFSASQNPTGTGYYVDSEDLRYMVRGYAYDRLQ